MLPMRPRTSPWPRWRKVNTSSVSTPWTAAPKSPKSARRWSPSPALRAWAFSWAHARCVSTRPRMCCRWRWPPSAKQGSTQSQWRPQPTTTATQTTVACPVWWPRWFLPLPQKPCPSSRPKPWSGNWPAWRWPGWPSHWRAWAPTKKACLPCCAANSTSMR